MNKGVYVVQNGKLKKVIASGYGDGLVKTVNGIGPDQRGDVDLGEIASPTDVEVAKDNAIKTARDLAKVDMEMATEGIRGFMHRGVWASGVEYEKNNLVIYNESVYQAIKDIKDSDKEIEVEEPETEVEDNEDVIEEVEGTEEPTEPTEEPNPVEVNPEDEEFGKMYWRMFAPKTKERPRGTYAEAVNGIVPDETGNIDLGQLAMLGDVSDGIDLAVERSSSYTDEQIELIKQEGIGGEVSEQDLMDGIYEAKDHANIVADRARADANRYTDIEVSKMRDEISTQQFDIVFSTELPTDDDLKGSWRVWGVREGIETDSIQIKDIPIGSDVHITLSDKNGLQTIATARKLGDNAYSANETTLLFYNETFVSPTTRQKFPVKYDETEEYFKDGNPNYILSNIRQWLNSSALSDWYQPTHDTDKATGTMQSLQGFKSYLPEAIKDVLRPVKRTIGLPKDQDSWNWESGVQFTEFYDSISLPSMKELTLSDDYIEGRFAPEMLQVLDGEIYGKSLSLQNGERITSATYCTRGSYEPKYSNEKYKNKIMHVELKWWQATIDTKNFKTPNQAAMYETDSFAPLMTIDMNTPVHKHEDGTYYFADETRYKTAKVLEWYTKVQY